MTEQKFNEILLNTIGAFFDERSYRFADGCFFYNRTNGLRNIISFDFDVKGDYRVFIGINYPYGQDVDLGGPPDGALYYRYFTGGSLSIKPKDFYFKNIEQLEKHLLRFRDYYNKELENDFFGSIHSLEDYADILDDSDCSAKYYIYKLLSLYEKALIEAEKILEHYKGRLDIPEIKTLIENDVKVFIQKNQKNRDTN